MLGNYKIRVNSEAESKEAQELFFELGYYWNTGLGVKHLNSKFLYAKNNQITMGYCSDNFIDSASCELTLQQLRDMVAQSKNEQGLISGADALRALADGKDVEYLYGGKFKRKWLSVTDEQILITAITEDKFKFRLKPRTIKLSLDVPAPFEPKVGEEYYYLNSGRESGYAMKLHDGKQMDFMAIQFGAWRTEEEIKQFVAALRGVLK